MHDRTRTPRRQAVIGAVLAALALTAEAATVYRWRDASGAVHFSDQPPPEGTSGAEEVEIDLPPPAGAPAGADYYSIANQARRMAEQRLEAERQQAEIEAARQRAAPPEPAPTRPAPAQGEEGGGPGWVIGPGYWGPGYRPGQPPPGAAWWPQFPQRPSHRPPHHPAPDRPASDRPAVEREPPSFGVAVPRR